jgi:hypothetical protein
MDNEIIIYVSGIRINRTHAHYRCQRDGGARKHLSMIEQIIPKKQEPSGTLTFLSQLFCLLTNFFR